MTVDAFGTKLWRLTRRLLLKKILIVRSFWNKTWDDIFYMREAGSAREYPPSVKHIFREYPHWCGNPYSSCVNFYKIFNRWYFLPERSRIGAYQTLIWFLFVNRQLTWKKYTFREYPPPIFAIKINRCCTTPQMLRPSLRNLLLKYSINGIFYPCYKVTPQMMRHPYSSCVDRNKIFNGWYFLPMLQSNTPDDGAIPTRPVLIVIKFSMDDIFYPREAQMMGPSLRNLLLKYSMDDIFYPREAQMMGPSLLVLCWS